MPAVSKKQMEQARKIDLLSYLMSTQPDELIRLGTHEYTTRSHSSLKIRLDGVWHWWSRGISGKSALDYLVNVEGVAFTDAVISLTGQPIVSRYGVPAQPQKDSIVLPAPNGCTDVVHGYLQSREIHPAVIDHCIQLGILYESVVTSGSNHYHNCVFVGKDREGIPRYASLRGTRGGFRGEAKGSNKRFSFCLPSQSPEHRIIVVTESPIDALSYATIQYEDNPDEWRARSYLSLGGCSPLALWQRLKDYGKAPMVVLALDNDETGKAATQDIVRFLKQQGIHTVDKTPMRCKDYNEYLRICKADEHRWAHQQKRRNQIER